MKNKLGYKTAWFILLFIALTVFAVIAISVWLIQPFAPQTEKGVQISYLLKSWSPLLTICAALAVKQLKKIPILKDFWFDWKIYHPETQIYALGAR